MDTGTDRGSALHRAVFEDALGRRHHAVTPGGEPLEVLELRYELSNDASEAALRERVSSLAGVHSACFARVRGVQRINQNTSKLFVLSDRINGARLSSVLAAARQTTVALDVNASLCLIRQLVSAVAILHEKMPKFAHGAIAPERIVITPEARLVVADHAVGAALPQLRYTHERYWKELRVPLPVSDEPTFNQRADVMQVGVVALELLLGRPVERVEYPDHIDELTQRTWRLNANGTGKQLSAPLREWLLRMLQINKENAFSSVTDAWEELENVLGGGMGASFTALEAVMAEYGRKAAARAVAAPSAPAAATPTPAAATPAPAAAPAPAPARVTAPAAPAPAVASASPAPAAAASVAAAASAPAPVDPKPIASDRKPSIPFKKPVDPAIASGWVSPAAEPAAAPPSAAAPVTSAPKPSDRDSFSSKPVSIEPIGVPTSSLRLVTPPTVTSYEASIAAEAEIARQQASSRRRGRWVAVAALLALVVTGGALFGRKYVVPPAAAEAPGTLVVSTTPAGVAVIVDGQPRGVTPLTLELAPGSHELKLMAEGEEARIIPFSVTAGSTVAQTVEFAKATPTTGNLTIRTDPPGARVTIDGVANVGTTPINIEALTPGTHSVVLTNEVGSTTQEVTIEAGTTASLVVPMNAAHAVPVSGWISVSAPGEVQVYEDSQLLGTSAADRIMVSAGRHEFLIVNEAIAYRTTRVVVVAPGKVSVIKLDWPKGSLALNAQPWAEVWIDGERIGETPIGNHPVSIGTHEILFRHPELGEQVVRATVTATAPARVSVDMRKQR